MLLMILWKMLTMALEIGALGVMGILKVLGWMSLDLKRRISSKNPAMIAWNLMIDCSLPSPPPSPPRCASQSLV